MCTNASIMPPSQLHGRNPKDHILNVHKSCLTLLCWPRRSHRNARPLHTHIPTSHLQSRRESPARDSDTSRSDPDCRLQALRCMACPSPTPPAWPTITYTLLLNHTDTKVDVAPVTRRMSRESHALFLSTCACLRPLPALAQNPPTCAALCNRECTPHSHGVWDAQQSRWTAGHRRWAQNKPHHLKRSPCLPKERGAHYLTQCFQSLNQVPDSHSNMIGPCYETAAAAAGSPIFPGCMLHTEGLQVPHLSTLQQ